MEDSSQKGCHAINPFSPSCSHVATGMAWPHRRCYRPRLFGVFPLTDPSAKEPFA